MKIKIAVDEDLLNDAVDCTGNPDPEELVRLALINLMQREVSRRVAALQRTEPPRRRNC